jgi:hypothetical protein
VQPVIDRPADQGREQAGDLAAGKRDHPWWWGMLVAFGARDDQEGVGNHGQGHPPEPGAPAADLVLIQAAQPLGGLEGFLHRPAAPGHPRQAANGRVAGPAQRYKASAPVCRLRRMSSRRAQPAGAPSAVSSTCVQAYQRLPLAPSPGLMVSQRSGGTPAASNLAGVGGPSGTWSASVHRMASTYGIRWVSSQARKLGLPP